MIKINYHNWYGIVLLDEIPNFIIDYEPRFISLQETGDLNLLYANIILVPKSYTIHMSWTTCNVYKAQAQIVSSK